MTAFRDRLERVGVLGPKSPQQRATDDLEDEYRAEARWTTRMDGSGIRDVSLWRDDHDTAVATGTVDLQGKVSMNVTEEIA